MGSLSFILPLFLMLTRNFEDAVAPGGHFNIESYRVFVPRISVLTRTQNFGGFWRPNAEC